MENELVNFAEISPEEMENALKLIGKDWMLVTAGKPENYNMMTASWGMMGVLWNKPVCACFIRPQRYTYVFAEANDRITMSFFDEEYRDALKYCGSHSGRDGDKAKACGLTPMALADESAVIFGEAKLALVCRKLYVTDLKKEEFLDATALMQYPNEDFHRCYICEIEKVLKKQN